jgi:pimeloyl-ACP methyl ester carboxylesterase
MDFFVAWLTEPACAVALPDGPGARRVLLVPGGASTVHGYFPQLATARGRGATVIGVDPPGIGAASDRRPLRLAAYAPGLS